MKKENIEKLIKTKEQELEKIIKEINNLKQELQKSIEVDNTSDKNLEIFANYFKGREDIYAYLQVDKKDSTKKYYIKACQNEWRAGLCNKLNKLPCKICKHRLDKPLTKETIKNHLYNNKTIGIYPLLKDDTCYFLALDFDNKNCEKNIEDEIKNFVNLTKQFQIPILIEKSRSGNGFHIWIFFTEKIPAKTARLLGKLLLEKTILQTNNLNTSSFDRMFPNQDYLPAGGCGNLIALPLQTEPSLRGNTLFYNENLEPINLENQFIFLENIKKLSKKELTEKIKLISNTEVKEESKPTHEINIILSNMINIKKEGLNTKLKNSLHKLATFANPEFFKKQALRLSVYNTPMIIDCSREDEEFLQLPRGTMEKVIELCKKNNIKINIDDKRNPGCKINVGSSCKLYDYQQVPFDELNKYENGILQAPPGFGKTVIGCKMIEAKQTNTLIIVNNLQLLAQWQNSIKKFLNVTNVGEISGKRKNITNIIDVASIKSLWSKGKVSDILKNYGMIIIDECHHASAYTFEQTLNNTNAKYIYGITATPTREDGHSPIMKMQCGDIRYEVNTLNYNKKLNIPMKVIIKKSHINIKTNEIDNYQISEIYNLISKDNTRTNKIIKDVSAAYNNNKNILVVTERLEHLKVIYEELQKFSDNILMFHGRMSKKALEQNSKISAKIEKNNENKIIVATGSYIGEGFDDTKLDVLFMTMPISGKTRLTQYTGRLNRKNNNKKEITIYDYADDNFPITRNMLIKRKRIYKQLGYTIETS